jgi:LL-H family phage holin
VNDILSQLATALVVALVPVAIGALGYLVRAAISYLKARTSAEHYALLEKLATQAVAAAEQTMKSSAGKAKLEAATAVVRNALLKKGIQLDESQIAAAIEAAVYVEKGFMFSSADTGVSAIAALPEPDAQTDAPADSAVI